MGNGRDGMGSGLAIVHVHRNRALHPEKVLRYWDAAGHRRITLMFDENVTFMLNNL